MKIRKIDGRISERDLNPIELCELTDLLRTARRPEGEERIKYLISLFNNGGKSLEKHEMCFLINYLIKGRVIRLDSYGLYVSESGQKLILSSKEIQAGDYTIDTSSDVIQAGNYTIDTSRDALTIVPDLEKLGFEFLETKESLLAFCAERNIVFWAPSIEEFNEFYKTGRFYYFQQPRVAYDGEKVVSFYSSVNDCNEKKTDFPLFNEGGASDLWLYNIRKDKGDESVFNSSMKRIAQYPELYHAVGSENQAIIDKIILKELYPMLNEIYYNSDACLNSKRLYMIQIVKKQYGGDAKKAKELLSTRYDFQNRPRHVK